MKAGDIARTLAKLLLWSLAVGLLLSFLGLTPLDLLSNLDDVLARLYARLRDLVAWALPYILLGAAVVVPVWLLLQLYHRLKR